MKLRVIKNEDGTFTPQYLDEESKFGPEWRECRLDNLLVARYYHTLESAQEVCLKYRDKNPGPVVVWESSD